MKKLLIVTIVLCLVLGLAACGASTTPNDTASSNTNTDTAPSAPAEDGFAFTYKDTEITLHAPAAPIVSALGEPVKYTESTSCAFEGLDKSYYYGSFYLETYPNNGEDFVYGWWFADDSVTTQEGIYIGATQAEVEAAYGAESFNGSNAYILNGTTSTLTIILEGGNVTSIQYDAVIE